MTTETHQLDELQNNKHKCSLHATTMEREKREAKGDYLATFVLSTV